MANRIQLSRRKGWRMASNTVKVARPGKWGNVFRPGPAIVSPYCTMPAITAVDCVRMHREYMERCLTGAFARAVANALETLRGRNLACWCHLCPTHATGKPFAISCPDCAPCHADTLGELANRPALQCEVA